MPFFRWTIGSQASCVGIEEETLFYPDDFDERFLPGCGLSAIGDVNTAPLEGLFPL